MKTKELKALVREEAARLREYATPEELSRLDFDQFAPTIPTMCIYGQTTGDCFSPRATTLLNKCARPFSKAVREYEPNGKKRFDKNVRNLLAVKDGHAYFSPIEFYIAQPDAKNKQLIAYLKGKRNTLPL